MSLPSSIQSTGHTSTHSPAISILQGDVITKAIIISPIDLDV